MSKLILFLAEKQNKVKQYAYVMEMNLNNFFHLQDTNLFKN